MRGSLRTPLQYSGREGFRWDKGNLQWDDWHDMADSRRPYDGAVFFPFAAIDVEREGVMKCLARVALWGPPGTGEIGRAEAEFELTAG